MKRCVHCDTVKPADAFRPMRGMRDGLDSWCIECHREYGRDRERRLAAEDAPRRRAAAVERDARRVAAAQVRRWEREAVRITYRECETCRVLMVASRSDRRYCSYRCRPSTARRRAKLIPTRACDCCGAAFAGSGRRRFCSPKCGLRFWSRHHRATKRAVYVEQVHPFRVFERDDWRCYLCGDPLLRGAHRHDPLAPEVDHVIPLARGGDHSYANVRAAHRRCNQSKGARLVEVA